MNNKFSPSEAAISIFKFAKTEGKFTLRYMLIMGILTAITVTAMAASGIFDLLEKITALGDNPSEAQITQLAQGYNFIPLIACIVFSSITSIMTIGMGLRKLVRGQEEGALGLSFGIDEIRLFFGLTLIGFTYFSITAIISALFAFTKMNDLILAPLVMVVLIVFIVYFSQYGVEIINNNKFNIFDSPKAVKGNFWNYFGAYVLCGVISTIGLLFVQVTLMAIFGAGQSDSAFPKSVGEALQFNYVIYNLLYGGASGFVQLAFMSVGAYANKNKNKIDMSI